MNHRGNFEDVCSMILLATICMLQISSIIMLSCGADLFWVLVTLTSPWLLFVLFVNGLIVYGVYNLIMGWIKNDKSSSKTVSKGSDGLVLPIPEQNEQERSDSAADRSGEDSSGEHDNPESSIKE